MNWKSQLTIKIDAEDLKRKKISFEWIEKKCVRYDDWFLNLVFNKSLIDEL